MAITTSYYDVNGGKAGASTPSDPWTKSDVLDTLETVFSDLGWNNGTQKNGVPCAVVAPGYTSDSYNKHTRSTTTSYGKSYSSDDVPNMEHCGGPDVTDSYQFRHFYVSADGTSAYRILEEFRFNGTLVDTAGSGGADTIGFANNDIQTGDPLIYAEGKTNTDPDYNTHRIGGLEPNTTYYAIRVNSTHFKLANSLTNANNGIAIDISPAQQSGWYLKREDDSLWNNYTITCEQGDVLNFYSSGASSAGGAFYLLEDSENYDSTKHLALSTDTDISNYQTSGTPSGQGTTTTQWVTKGFLQSEHEVLDPLRYIGQGSGTNLGDFGIKKYKYANSLNSDMKGDIILNPSVSRTSRYTPYWKYTVIGSTADTANAGGNGGTGRTDLNLRLYRGTGVNHTQGRLTDITINNLAENWKNNDIFTIPGDQIGGITPDNDITFGVNQDESPSGSGNGTPTLLVTNLGAGSNFYQKSLSGYYAIAKVTHDVSKTYGTTYYGFGLDSDNHYKITITSGIGWDYLNVPGINSTNNVNSSSSYEESYSTRLYGRYMGENGLDVQSQHSYLRRDDGGADDYWREMNYARTTTPTQYPLQIRVYRAQAPQDTDFAIIQFIQIVNGDIETYATFSIAKGGTHGDGAYDLDYVYQDAVLNILSGTRSINFQYGNTSYNYDASNGGVTEPVNFNTKARAATYGWLRDSNTQYGDMGTASSSFVSNIDTNNAYNTLSGSSIVTYYRNSTYDRYNYTGGANVMSSSANYYKPIKGLPVANNLFPIPYYLPDDFVMLQVATTPGLVAFRTGDTVTISGSEVYVIIRAGYESQQNGLDNIDNNSTIGMLFMARII